MEAEFVARTTTIQEALWLGSFLNHLGSFVKPNNKPITIYCT